MCSGCDARVFCFSRLRFVITVKFDEKFECLNGGNLTSQEKLSSCRLWYKIYVKPVALVIFGRFGKFLVTCPSTFSGRGHTGTKRSFPKQNSQEILRKIGDVDIKRRYLEKPFFWDDKTKGRVCIIKRRTSLEQNHFVSQNRKVHSFRVGFAVFLTFELLRTAHGVCLLLFGVGIFA